VIFFCADSFFPNLALPRALLGLFYSNGVLQFFAPLPPPPPKKLFVVSPSPLLRCRDYFNAAPPTFLNSSILPIPGAALFLIFCSFSFLLPLSKTVYRARLMHNFLYSVPMVIIAGFLLLSSLLTNVFGFWGILVGLPHTMLRLLSKAPISCGTCKENQRTSSFFPYPCRFSTDMHLFHNPNPQVLIATHWGLVPPRFTLSTPPPLQVPLHGPVFSAFFPFFVPSATSCSA